VLLFGGTDENGKATNTIHVLDLAGLAKGQGWTLLDCKGEIPSPRQVLAACCACVAIMSAQVCWHVQVRSSIVLG
jgi:hypothetical protein